MRFPTMAAMVLALLLIPTSASAQTTVTDPSRFLPVVRVANPAALALRDLNADYQLLGYDTVRTANDPRTDFLVAYGRLRDSLVRGPMFVEMRLAIFSEEETPAFIDNEMALYLTGVPELTPLAAPPGLEDYQLFTVTDRLQDLSGYAALFATGGGFASIAALGEQGDVVLDDLMTIAEAASARLEG